MRLQLGKRACVALLLLLQLCGCSSYKFAVEISASDTKPTFSFAKPFFAKPVGSNSVLFLEEFSVVEKGAHGWNYTQPLWRIERNPAIAAVAVDKIQYGVIPAGFVESVQPAKLSPGVQYLVVAFGPGSGGDLEFELPRTAAGSTK
jgi:hypothetical protein